MTPSFTSRHTGGLEAAADAGPRYRTTLERFDIERPS